MLMFVSLLSPFGGKNQLSFSHQYEIIVFATIGTSFISVYFFLINVLDPGRIKIRFSYIDFILLAFFCYVIIRNLFLLCEIDYIALYGNLSLLIFYLFFRYCQNVNSWYNLLVFPVVGIFHVFYGIINQTNLFSPGYGLSDITGGFNNTGIFGGFLSIIVVTSLGVLFQSQNQNGRVNPLYLKYLIILGLIFLSIQLLSTNSRAAWLSSICGIIYLFNKQYNLYGRFRHLSKCRTAVVLIILVIGVFLLLLKLYYFKKDSADGRFLIWKVSTRMLADEPFFGHGINGFAANYMYYQAAFGTEKPDSNEMKLAVDNHLMFNEFFRITVEEGIIGLLIVSLLVIIIFRSKEKRDHENNGITDVLRASFLSFLIFSLFSYPLKIFQFQFVLVFMLAVLSKHLKQFPFDSFEHNNRNSLWRFPFNINQTRIFFFSLLLVLSSYCSVHSLKYLNANRQWGTTLDQFSENNYSKSMSVFQSVYPVLKNNSLFLSTYGKALNSAGYYNEAIRIIHQANYFLPNSSNYIELGKSFEHLNEYSLAEDSWNMASAMVPNRFTPKYLLVKMLLRKGDTNEAGDIATELVNKNVKIWSPELQAILDEMKQIKNTNVNSNH